MKHQSKLMGLSGVLMATLAMGSMFAATTAEATNRGRPPIVRPPIVKPPVGPIIVPRPCDRGGVSVSPC